ncbi:MAG: PDR/VanB family oxidoreductase [Sporichthyaceae bacterium]
MEPEFEVLVKGKEVVADGVVRLVLVRPDGAELPGWLPGAHVDLMLGRELVRQYSLCGDPGDSSRYEVAVLREAAGRGGSAHVHDVLAEGEVVRVRGPRNNFALVPADRYLFVAGGVGITPIVPMLAAAAAAGRRFRLLYGGRTRDSMAFADALVGRYGDRVEICPQDERGLLDLDAALGESRDDTAVYCCGPEALLAAVEERCAAWPTGALHVERFAPKPIVANADADGPFEVELGSDGRIVPVPAGCSVLDALAEAGIAVNFSCAEGTCGTCETGVLAGVPDHRDSLLSQAERAANEVMFVCVSRSRTPRLTLDL